LPKADQLRIWNDLNLLAAAPRPIGRAEQIEKDIFRIPTGRYRSVYRVLDDDRLVAVFLIGHRRYVYDFLRRSGRETNPLLW
jgi:mRNA-degrading endonuclease RelE of RelBE toxin-antitoxin system